MRKQTKVIVALALATTIAVSVAGCSAKDSGNENESTTISAEVDATEQAEEETTIVEVTDNSGEVVTNKKGQTVTAVVTVQSATPAAPVTKKNGKPAKTTTTKPSTTKKELKNVPTTEKPTEYTTLNSSMLPEDSLDYYVSESLGLCLLEEYYAKDYVVNYDYPNFKGELYTYAIFKADDKKKDQIAYYVTIDRNTGETIEINTKNGKTKTLDIITPNKN